MMGGGSDDEDDDNDDKDDKDKEENQEGEGGTSKTSKEDSGCSWGMGESCWWLEENIRASY